MTLRPFAGLLIALFAIMLALAPIAPGNSAGANDGTATSGCTCHAAASSADVTVKINGVPEHVRVNETYSLSFVVTGPAPIPGVGQNTGGFALVVDGGTLSTADDNTQIKGTMLTHTAAGNDQRSWNFRWQAPDVPGNVTFSFAGNAVNGDSINNLADAWNKGTLAVPVAAALTTAPSQSSPVPTSESMPVPGTIALVGLLGASVVLARRRKTT